MVIPASYRRLFLLVCIFACADVAAAACLTGHLSIQQEYDQSEWVFIGHVISEKKTGQSKDYSDGTTYVLSVDVTLKGKPSAEVEMFSENSSGRFPMAVGQRYLIFAYSALGRMMVNNCGNSGLLAEKSETIAAVRGMAKPRVE